MSDHDGREGDEPTVYQGTLEDGTTPLMGNKGEVSFIAAFPGTFVAQPDVSAAKMVAKKFECLGRRICVYRIEIVDVYDPPASPA